MVAEPPIAKLNDLQQETYTVPTYTELKPCSKQVTVVLHNLSSRKVTFNLGRKWQAWQLPMLCQRCLSPRIQKIFAILILKSGSRDLEMDENVPKNPTAQKHYEDSSLEHSQTHMNHDGGTNKLTKEGRLQNSSVSQTSLEFNLGLPKTEMM